MRDVHTGPLGAALGEFAQGRLRATFLQRLTHSEGPPQDAAERPATRAARWRERQ
jgi:hypothetical protein